MIEFLEKITRIISFEQNLNKISIFKFLNEVFDK
jgi:hypothetical protein